MNNCIKQAGAIVFRTVESHTQVLLILSKKKPHRRIFPKGHIEVGESTEQTAHRELLEEAGIKGEITGTAGSINYTWNDKTFDVTYHTFNYQYNVSVGEDGRDPDWFSPLDAYDLLPSEELRELFRLVVEDKKIVTIGRG